MAAVSVYACGSPPIKLLVRKLDSDYTPATGLILGLALGFWLWGNEPAFVDNVASVPPADSFVLVKLGSGQVAVFHGFAFNRETCQIAAQHLQSLGGFYACNPALSELKVYPLQRLWLWLTGWVISG